MVRFRREEVSMRLGTTSLAAVIALAAAGPAFEPTPAARASKILPAKLLEGPHYTVADAVTTEGFYQKFHIASDYGDFDANGRTMLRVRLAEVDALTRLAEVSRGEEFAKAAGTAVLDVGKGVASVVKDPAGTAKGIGTGLKRFGTNLGRK